MEEQSPKITPISETTLTAANAYSIIALLSGLSISAFFYFVVKDLFLTAVIGVGVLATIGNYIILRTNKYYELGAYSFLIVTGLLVLSIFIKGWDSIGLIWPLIWALFCFKIYNGKAGLIFTGIFLFLAIIILVLKVFKVLDLPYETISIVNFFVAYIILGTILILFKGSGFGAHHVDFGRNFFETSLDPLIIIDKEGNVKDANQISEFITGLSRERILKTNFADYFTEPELAREILRQILRGPVHNYPLVVHNSADGKNTDVLVNATTQSDENGEVQSIFVVIRDITELEEAEKKKTQLLKDFENVNKELETFTHSVAHDLRSPLRSINGFTSLISKSYGQNMDEEGQRLLGNVISESKRMGRLIDDLMTFSDLGKEETDKSAVDMNAVVNEVMRSIPEVDLQNKKVNISDLPPALGDPALLNHVFSHLISNALKYSAQKPNPIIEIGSTTENEENIYFVKDNGAGFDMRYYNKLFNVFQRLHDQDEFEGTGVGLAIVHRIITRLGGRVWAEGVVKEGATFYFSLPKI